MGSIHHRYVPGFYMHLQRSTNRLFTAMQPGEPWWRHNYSFETMASVTNCVGHGQKWAHLVVPATRLAAASAVTATSISPTGTNTGAGDANGIDEEALASGGAAFVRDNLQLRTEFQTIQRLPQTRQLLFTVKAFVDPLVNLEQWPAAAQALGAAMRRKYKGMKYYQGIGRPSSQQAILGYLDGIVGQAGLVPGPVLPQPWEREALVDGTFARQQERNIARL
jgi:hypothetical protein